MEINEKPRLIEDSIVFRDKNIVYVYSQNKKLVAKVKSLDKHAFQKLKNSGFFSPITYTARKYPEKSFVNLMLLLSRDCLMKCRYCYVNAGINNALMSTEIADRAVSLYLSTKPSNPRVTLFGGGEPTLNFSAIKYIINKYGNDTRWILTTSGILSSSFLKWLIEHDVNIGFSIDGPPIIQNYLRPLKNGKPSSQIVENSIRIWKNNANKPLAVRATITNDTVFSIDKILEYFEKLDIDTLHLESLYNLGRAVSPEQAASLKQPSVKDFAKAVIKSLEWGKKKNKRVKVGCLSYFFNPSLLSYCGPLSGQTIVVNHEGLLTACSEVVDNKNENWDIFSVGKLCQSFELDENKINHLACHVYNKMNSCSNCFVRYICRGGCVHKNLTETGNLSDPDPKHCNFMKIVVPALIKRMVTGEYSI